jgi:hypothetical protein
VVMLYSGSNYGVFNIDECSFILMDLDQVCKKRLKKRLKTGIKTSITIKLVKIF